MSKAIEISEDHCYDLDKSCNADIKIEPKESKSTLRYLDVSMQEKSGKQLSKEKKALIQTDSEDQTLSEENFHKVKIKTETAELTECPSKSYPHTWTNDAENQASIFQSLCENEIKIEPTQLTECSWLKSSYSQASSENNQDQASLIESRKEYTNKDEHKPSSKKNTDEAVKRKGNVSEEEKVQILAYKKAGHNPRYIAKKIGRNLATVYKVFQIQRLNEAASLGSELTTQSLDAQPKYNNGKKRKSPINEKETALILEYKAAGFSIREIAKQIGRAHQNISKHLSRLK